ncbi:MAG: DSD1 family PLP-dependent enzyme [Polaromonas sp.]
MEKHSLEELETPALILDEARMDSNIRRMRSHLDDLGVAFRPHVKTNKCIEVTRRLMQRPDGPITVSTLREAEYFASHGVKDILYAVCIAPNKLAHASEFLKRGIDLSLIVDSLEASRILVDWQRSAGASFGVLIEVDSDGHRSGVACNAPELIEIGRFLHDNGVTLRGVMTHAGSSYDCRSDDALRAMAEQERAAASGAAKHLRAAGVPCPVVSVGSTPTALFARHLEGVTEVRAGVFVFFDLVMAGIDVCRQSDIALSVLGTVIGHQREKGWTIIDAGWMAMSRDRGTAAQPLDQGYGVVCDIDGAPLDEFILIAANQEHGIIAHRSGDASRVPDLAIGDHVRILPNHACATAAQYENYQVLGANRKISATWHRFSGW